MKKIKLALGTLPVQHSHTGWKNIGGKRRGGRVIIWVYDTALIPERTSFFFLFFFLFCDCGYDGFEDESKSQPSAAGNTRVLIITAEEHLLGIMAFIQ